MDKFALDFGSLFSGVLSLLSRKYEVPPSPHLSGDISKAPTGQPTPGSGGAVLAAARADLGVHEDLGHNDGKRIREYFKNFGTTAGKDWCAAAVSTWLKEGGFSGVAGSMGARALGDQFKQAGLWVPKEEITAADLSPGNIAVFSRGSGGWQGHVGVIDSSSGDSFSSIEANSGAKSDSVVINGHSIKDGNLLGIGLVSGGKAHALASRVDLFVRLASR